MRRFLPFLVLIVFFHLTALIAGAETRQDRGENADVFAGRKIVGSVHFASKSAQLAPATQKKLREIAGHLQSAGATDFLRVEGRAGKKGKDGGISLATARGRAVARFLQEDLQMQRPVYFTGIPGDAQGSSDRVDLVLYENVLAREEGEKGILTSFFD